MLDKIDNRLDFMKRSTSNVSEPPELLRTLPCHTFGEIQGDAIGRSSPLVCEIMLGLRQPLDQGARQGGNA